MNLPTYKSCQGMRSLATTTLDIFRCFNPHWISATIFKLKDSNRKSTPYTAWYTMHLWPKKKIKHGVTNFQCLPDSFFYFSDAFRLSEFKKIRLRLKKKKFKTSPSAMKLRSVWCEKMRELVKGSDYSLLSPCFHGRWNRQQYLAPEPSVTGQPTSGEFLSSQIRS